MELDQLKYQLNQKLSTERGSRTDADFLELLKKRTHSVISKIHRSLLMEIFVCVIFLVVMCYVCFTTHHWTLKLYFGSLSIPVVVVGIFLIYLYRQTSDLMTSPKPIRNTLQTVVKLMDRFVRMYFQMTMAMIPICLTLSILLSYTEPVTVPELEKFFAQFLNASLTTWVFLILYVAGMVVGMYYFTKWYLRKLYGKYVDQLKQYIQELED